MALPHHHKIVRPIGRKDAKIWVVQLHPTQQELGKGYALAGSQRGIFREALMANGLDFEHIHATYIVPHVPPANSLDRWLVSKKEVQKDFHDILGPAVGTKFLTPDLLPWIAELQADIQKHRPNIIIAFGAPLSRILVGNHKISETRGTIHKCSLDPRVKVLPTYSPGATYANFSLSPIFSADIGKACRESDFPEIRTKPRTIYVPESVEDIQWFADKCRQAGIATIDIETVPARRQITEVGLAYSPLESMCIPIFDRTKPGYHAWSYEDEFKVWETIRTLAADPNVAVRGQGYQYDSYWLYALLGIPSCGDFDDSLILHHALFPEMPKDLGFLASIYCDEISWKGMARFKKKNQKENG